MEENGDQEVEREAGDIYGSGSTGGALLGLGTLLELLMLAAVAVRLYAKWRILKKYTSDDFTCVAAALTTTAYYVAGCYLVTTAASNSAEMDADTHGFAVSEWLSGWLAALAFLFVQLTLFLLYNRVFRPFRALRLAASFGILYSTLIWGALFIFRIAFDTPRYGDEWTQPQKTSRENTNHVIAIVLGVFDIFCVSNLLAVPILGMEKLKIRGKRKVGILAVIFVGSWSLVASAVRLAYRIKSDPHDETQQPLYITSLTGIVELTLGVICCSTPDINRFLRHHFSSWDRPSRTGAGPLYEFEEQTPVSLNLETLDDTTTTTSSKALISPVSPTSSSSRHQSSNIEYINSGGWNSLHKSWQQPSPRQSEGRRATVSTTDTTATTNTQTPIVRERESIPLEPIPVSRRPSQRTPTPTQFYTPRSTPRSSRPSSIVLSLVPWLNRTRSPTMTSAVSSYPADLCGVAGGGGAAGATDHVNINDDGGHEDMDILEEEEGSQRSVERGHDGAAANSDLNLNLNLDLDLDMDMDPDLDMDITETGYEREERRE